MAADFQAASRGLEDLQWLSGSELGVPITDGGRTRIERVTVVPGANPPVQNRGWWADAPQFRDTNGPSFAAAPGGGVISYVPYMEAYMELTKKTTILFSAELHRRLSELAARRGRSLGELVREACEAQYGVVGGQEQVKAVGSLAALSLPVGTPAELKRESVPKPDALLP